MTNREHTDKWLSDNFDIELGSDTATGSVYGFRAMNVIDSWSCTPWSEHLNQHSPEVFDLKARTFGEYAWSPGENVATHLGLYNTERCTAGPASANCECGFYAYWGTEKLFDEFAADQVMTVIEAYGHVTLHAEGFRAEKARVVGFIALHGNDVERTIRATKVAGAGDTCVCPSCASRRYQYKYNYPSNEFVRNLATYWGVAFFETLKEAHAAVKTTEDYKQPTPPKPEGNNE